MPTMYRTPITAVPEGFEYVLDILEDACAGLLQSI